MFEYNIEIPVNEVGEKVTKTIMDATTGGYSPYTLYKFVDHEANGKKTRTFILTSLFNIHPHVFELFNGVEPTYRCYYKTIVPM